MSTKILKKLRSAADAQRPVRIQRDKLKKGTDVIEGLVTTVGPDWVIVTTMWDGIYFDGWEALRIRDITGVVEKSSPFNAFFARAVASLGTGPGVPSVLADAVAAPDKQALRLILESASMCGVSLEESWPGSLFVGSFEGTWNKKKHVVRQIGVSGAWHKDGSMFPAKKITRLSIGSRYLNGLEKFGDPFPQAAV